MLRIRLQRTGRSNDATFRIVVADKDKPVKGKFVEVIGHYLPTRSEAELTVNEERVSHWIKNGALPTDTVARLLKRSGMKDMEKYMSRYTHKRNKKAPPEEPAAAPAAPVAEAAPEAPAEEAKTPEAEAPAAEAPATEENSDTEQKDS